MDEMVINTGFMQGIIKRIIEKAIEKKLGHKIEINFNGPIEANFNGDNLLITMNASASIKKDEIRDILAEVL